MDKGHQTESQDCTLSTDFTQWITRHSQNTEQLVRGLLQEPYQATLMEELENIKRNQAKTHAVVARRNPRGEQWEEEHFQGWDTPTAPG
jgi:hypothetical protein